METPISKAVSYYDSNKAWLDSTYPKKVIVVFEDAVVFDSYIYAEAYEWVIVDAYKNKRDFMDYLIADLTNNSIIGAYHILWEPSSPHEESTI